MKNTIICSVVIALLALLTSSCSSILEPDANFISGNDISLIVKGETILTYEPAYWQLSYNPAKQVFRAFEDDLSKEFNVNFSETPRSVGQTIDATVTWNKSGKSESLNGEFKVVKVSGDKYWLWCGNKKKQIAIAIRLFE